MSEDMTIKLGRILEQLKFSDAQIQEMLDNGNTDTVRLGEILAETQAMLDKLSINKGNTNE